MYKFHYDYIKRKYDQKPKLLFADTDSSMYEIINEDVFEGSSSDKEMLDFSNYSTKLKYYDNSNKLVKDKNRDVAIKEFVWLKPKTCSFLVNNSKHKKAKSVNKDFVAKISHNEYKDALLNNKCIKHSRKEKSKQRP